MPLDPFEDACPVPLELLGALYRADDEDIDTVLFGLPERIRAELSVYLYGRSHTHALGIRVAAGCEAASLRRAAGLLGNALYEQSRRPLPRKLRRDERAPTRAGISLGGARSASLRNAV